MCVSGCMCVLMSFIEFVQKCYLNYVFKIIIIIIIIIKILFYYLVVSF